MSVEVFDVVVAGAGISGLSIAFFLQQQEPQKRYLILERSGRAGGSLFTQEEGGCTLDWGAQGILGSTPSMMRLIRGLGLESELVVSEPNARQSAVFHKGKLRAIPSLSLSALGSDILSLKGRMRFLRESWVPKKTDDAPESVFDFFSRRFGEEAAEMIFSPMVWGWTATDARDLSMASLLPRWIEIEREFGSVSAAMRNKQAEKAPALSVAGGLPLSDGAWMTFRRGGMGMLTRTLATRLMTSLRPNTEILALRPIESPKRGFRLQLSDGRLVETRVLVLAMPPLAVAPLLGPVLPTLVPLLQSIRYAPLRVIGAAFPKALLKKPFQGSSVFVHPSEKRTLSALHCTSNLFPFQAPEDQMLLRLLVTASDQDLFARISDNFAVEKALRDACEILGISASPSLARLHAWSHAIPRYHLEHPAVVDSIMTQIKILPGLYLLNSAYGGVGVHECVERADRTLQAILHRLIGD
ncbi:MAG: protoporphyrinogen oxidase [Myxococcales bacterium]|nr:protoporphyrinogen oxidase [Myxococcales bacterium]